MFEKPKTLVSILISFDFARTMHRPVAERKPISNRNKQYKGSPIFKRRGQPSHKGKSGQKSPKPCPLSSILYCFSTEESHANFTSDIGAESVIHPERAYPVGSYPSTEYSAFTSLARTLISLSTTLDQPQPFEPPISSLLPHAHKWQNFQYLSSHSSKTWVQIYLCMKVESSIVSKARSIGGSGATPPDWTLFAASIPQGSVFLARRAANRLTRGPVALRTTDSFFGTLPAMFQLPVQIARIEVVGCPCRSLSIAVENVGGCWQVYILNCLIPSL